MPITETQARDLFATLETAVVTILTAQAAPGGILAGLLGTTRQGAYSVESGLRNSPRDYPTQQLPAVSIKADRFADADVEADGAVNEVAVGVDMTAYVLDRGADLNTVSARCGHVAAAVAQVLRRQIRNDSALNTALGGGASDCIIKNVSGDLLVAKEEDLFEVLMVLSYRVELDICVEP